MPLIQQRQAIRGAKRAARTTDSHPTELAILNEEENCMVQNQGKFALDNLTYDIITVLHEKSKGLEAFDQYIKDVQGDQELRHIFEQMRQNDQNLIQQLQQHLHRRLGQVSGQQQNKAA